MAKGYPENVANLAGRCVAWLESHWLPGVDSFWVMLKFVDRFDMEAAKPRRRADGETEFPEPIMGGLYLYETFETLPSPVKINGPEHGTILMTPLIASAASAADKCLTVMFLMGPERSQIGATMEHYDGKLFVDGSMTALSISQTLGLEVSEASDRAKDAPHEGPYRSDFYGALNDIIAGKS